MVLRHRREAFWLSVKHVITGRAVWASDACLREIIEMKTRHSQERYRALAKAFE